MDFERMVRSRRLGKSFTFRLASEPNRGQNSRRNLLLCQQSDVFNCRYISRFHNCNLTPKSQMIYSKIQHPSKGLSTKIRKTENHALIGCLLVFL